MKIKRVLSIDHFCLPGTMDDAVTFYRDVLGAKIGPEQPWLAEYGFRALNVWLGEDMPFHVGVSESVNDELATGKQIKRSAPTFAILAFEVEDIDEAIAELRDKGIRVHDKLKMRFPGFKTNGFDGWYETMIHPKSAFGVIIELIEFSKAPPDTEW